MSRDSIRQPEFESLIDPGLEDIRAEYGPFRYTKLSARAILNACTSTSHHNTVGSQARRREKYLLRVAWPGLHLILIL
jgi:hypothetical protein